MREFSRMRGRQGQPRRQRRRPVAAIAAVAAGLLAAGLLATSAANAGVTAAAPSSPAAVPCSSVGAGWVLAEYSTGTVYNRGTTTLELVSPSGAKYTMYTWAKSATAPIMAAWSPSKTEVLLELVGKSYGTFDRLNMQTGKITAFKLGQGTGIVSYTRPTGLQFLATATKTTATTYTETIERLTKTGQLVKALVTEKSSIGTVHALGPVYAPDGASIALQGPGGVGVVSNAGGAVKKLPVPGADKTFGCGVARWWNSTTILASCGRMWLVPANGAAPKPLTPARGAINTGGNIDLGDVAAWQLPSGLYLNSLSPEHCIEVLNRQNADGSITTQHIPGLNPFVLAAAGPRLLIFSENCTGPNTSGAVVAWYNPATRAKTVLFTKGIYYLSNILPFPNVADAANNL